MTKLMRNNQPTWMELEVNRTLNIEMEKVIRKKILEVNFTTRVKKVYSMEMILSLLVRIQVIPGGGTGKIESYSIHILSAIFIIYF